MFIYEIAVMNFLFLFYKTTFKLILKYFFCEMTKEKQHKHNNNIQWMFNLELYKKKPLDYLKTTF